MRSEASTNIFNLGPDCQETGRRIGPNHPHLIPSTYYANMNVTLALLCPTLPVVRFGKVTNPRSIRTRIIIVFGRSLPPVDSAVSHLVLETSPHVACCDFLVISLQLNYYDHCLLCMFASGLLHIITSPLLHIITVGSSMGTLCTCVLTICNNIIE